MSTAPTPTPEKKNNLLLWLLGIAGIGLAVVIVGGLLLAGYLVKGIRVSRTGRAVEVRTPVGPFSVSERETKSVGLPVYPGATTLEPGKNVELGFPEEQGLGIATARYQSPDPPEKVDAWYRERLGPEFKREEPGDDAPKIRGKRVHIQKGDIVYMADKDDLVRIVTLSNRGGGTAITLLRLGAQEAQ